jgi:membrane protease subunit HflC
MTTAKPKLKKGPIITIILIIVAIIIIFQFIYVVREDEQVVLVRFGEIIRSENEGNKDDAGLHWKSPVVQAISFTKKIQRWDGYVTEIPTKPDNQKILVDTTARWRIVEPKLYYESLKGIESEAAKKLDDIIDSAVRNIIRGSFFVQIVASDPKQIEDYFLSDPKMIQFVDEVRDSNGYIKGRMDIEDDILSVLKKNTTENFGIEVLDIIIKRVDYNQTNRSAAYDRMVAERNKIATEKEAVGEKRAKEIEGEISRYRSEKISEAYEIAEKLRGDGDAEAAKIYAEAYTTSQEDLAAGYASKEEFYEFFKLLEAYENLSPASELTISTESDFFKMLKDMEDPFK